MNMNIKSNLYSKFAPNTRGFTIVELMISLTVLSTILVMSTGVLIQIGALYDKGVNASKLQNATRNIISDVSGALQFSGNAPGSCTNNSDSTTCATDVAPPSHNPIAMFANSPTNVYAYCIGSTRYSYTIDRELGADQGRGNVQTAHVLWRDTMPSSTQACTPLDLTKSDPTADAGISNSTNGYEMAPDRTRLDKFHIQYNSTVGTYTITLNMAYGDTDLLRFAAGKANCKGGTGSQFCATSELTVTSQGRVQ